MVGHGDLYSGAASMTNNISDLLYDEKGRVGKIQTGTSKMIHQTSNAVAKINMLDNGTKLINPTVVKDRKVDLIPSGTMRGLFLKWTGRK